MSVPYKLLFIPVRWNIGKLQRNSGHEQKGVMLFSVVTNWMSRGLKIAATHWRPEKV